MRYAWSWALVRSAGSAGWRGADGQDDQPRRRQFSHNAPDPGGALRPLASVNTAGDAYSHAASRASRGGCADCSEGAAAERMIIMSSS